MANTCIWIRYRNLGSPSYILDSRRIHLALPSLHQVRQVPGSHSDVSADRVTRAAFQLLPLILCYIVFGAPSISLLREVIEVKKHCCIGYQTTAERMGLDLIERVQSYVLPLQYLMVAVYGQS